MLKAFCDRCGTQREYEQLNHFQFKGSGSLAELCSKCIKPFIQHMRKDLKTRPGWQRTPEDPRDEKEANDELEAIDLEDTSP